MVRLAALMSVCSHIGSDTEPSESEPDVDLAADEYQDRPLNDQQ